MEMTLTQTPSKCITLSFFLQGSPWVSRSERRDGRNGAAGEIGGVRGRVDGPRQFRRYTFEERDLAVLVSRPSMSAIWLVRWMDAQVPVWVPGGRRRLNMGDDPEKGKQKTWSGT